MEFRFSFSNKSTIGSFLKRLTVSTHMHSFICLIMIKYVSLKCFQLAGKSTAEVGFACPVCGQLGFHLCYHIVPQHPGPLGVIPEYHQKYVFSLSKGISYWHKHSRWLELTGAHFTSDHRWKTMSAEIPLGFTDLPKVGKSEPKR